MGNERTLTGVVLPGTELLIAFFLATLVFAIMPGPGILYTVARTLAGGRRDGLQAVFGLHLGGYVHVFAASLGLTVLFEAVPVLYTALKIAGAAYLIYLGTRIIFAGSNSEIEPVTSMPKGRAFRQSMVVEMLNPKTALFFLAFLPQFTDPAALLPIWAQFLVLGVIVNVVFSASDLICVFLSERLARAFNRSANTAKWMQRVGGSVLVVSSPQCSGH
jgi:threonine/homoserine/homoserine lactone efflux protein